MKPGHFPDGTPLPLPFVRTPCDGDIALWPYTVVTGTPSAVRELMCSLDRGYVEHLVAMGFVTVRCGDRPDRTEGAVALASVLGRDVPDTAREAYPELYAERVSFRGLRLPDIGAGLGQREAEEVVRRAHDLAAGGVQVVASTHSPLTIVPSAAPPRGETLCAFWDHAPDKRSLRVLRMRACQPCGGRGFTRCPHGAGCPGCGGHTAECGLCDGEGVLIQCPGCGQTPDLGCSLCDGDGFVSKAEGDDHG